MMEPNNRVTEVHLWVCDECGFYLEQEPQCWCGRNHTMTRARFVRADTDNRVTPADVKAAAYDADKTPDDGRD